MKYIEQQRNGRTDLLNWNWHKFLDTDTTNRDWYKANSLASQWVTCACGHQCDIIPRDLVGAPLDEELLALGTVFTNLIKHQEPSMARRILKLIENRSQELIDQINNETK